MSHVPHELREEFPEFADRITALKQDDEHFRHMADEYHALNREIHRMETGVAPASEFAEEDLRKKRMVLKDAIYGLLKN
ncbi:MAG: DUF465 domain-containing protein [Alphaproteobacteria bacterium]|nr:MAG: DUF465 domain-containing protein [Alphaproteobacteria bacterium]